MQRRSRRRRSRRCQCRLMLLGSSPTVGSIDRPLPCRRARPLTAPTSAPAAIPTGPPTAPIAAPANAPLVAPTPVPTGCDPGSPVIGSGYCRLREDRATSERPYGRFVKLLVRGHCGSSKKVTSDPRGEKKRTLFYPVAADPRMVRQSPGDACRTRLKMLTAKGAIRATTMSDFAFASAKKGAARSRALLRSRVKPLVAACLVR
jgi:hypothetical protein